MKKEQKQVEIESLFHSRAEGKVYKHVFGEVDNSTLDRFNTMSKSINSSLESQSPSLESPKSISEAIDKYHSLDEAGKKEFLNKIKEATLWGVAKK